MSKNTPTSIRIYFGDEETPGVTIPLLEQNTSGFYCLDEEKKVNLPNGENLLIYAEARLHIDPVDISLSIIEGDRVLDIGAAIGLVVCYQTSGGFEILVKIGTGAWD